MGSRTNNHKRDKWNKGNGVQARVAMLKHHQPIIEKAIAEHNPPRENIFLIFDVRHDKFRGLVELYKGKDFAAAHIANCADANLIPNLCLNVPPQAAYDWLKTINPMTGFWPMVEARPENAIIAIAADGAACTSSFILVA